MNSLIRPPASDDLLSHATARRKRLSTELRDHSPALIGAASAKGVPIAGLVRLAVADWLKAHPVADARSCAGRLSPHPGGDGVAMVTLRMPGGHARRLAQAARSAEVSQGAYVAGLLDGASPAPLVPEMRESVVAVARSNAALAALSGDLQALVRSLRQSSSLEQAKCAAS